MIRPSSSVVTPYHVRGGASVPQFRRSVQPSPPKTAWRWSRTSRCPAAINTWAVPVRPEDLSVAITAAVPPPTAVTTPRPSTAATEVSLEAHVNVAFATVWP